MNAIIPLNNIIENILSYPFYVLIIQRKLMIDI